jgi:hypothetical protein
LSAAHGYNKWAWLQPGVYGIALVIHWLLIPVLGFSIHWANWVPVLLTGLLIRWNNYNTWTKQLGSKDTIAWYPFLEIQYAVYLALGGVVTLLFKKRTWS